MLQPIQLPLQYWPSRSFKVNNFHVIWKSICDLLLVINSNLGPISHHLAAIACKGLQGQSRSMTSISTSTLTSTFGFGASWSLLTASVHLLINKLFISIKLSIRYFWFFNGFGSRLRDVGLVWQCATMSHKFTQVHTVRKQIRWVA